jgi:hypothetical protein
MAGLSRSVLFARSTPRSFARELEEENARLRPTTEKHTMKTGVELIAEERARQVSEEGWTPEHDDTHDCGEMRRAAAAYALNAYAGPDEAIPACWPWSQRWWKPAPHPMRNLVKAGALIAAEIDRLQRLKSTLAD